jgi:hypothetical protein
MNSRYFLRRPRTFLRIKLLPRSAWLASSFEGVLEGMSPTRSYPGSLAAITSADLMSGRSAKRSGACAISASATRPDTCSCRPDSSGKKSTIAKSDGPRRIAPNEARTLCW